MGKFKVLPDQRRERPLAPQSRGVTKRQQRRETHTGKEDEDIGVVGKRKEKFHTVLVGANPAIYTNLSSFTSAQRANPNAETYTSVHQRKVKSRIASYQESLKKQSQAAGPGTTHQSAVRFDTFSLPRGFALGTVRLNGKTKIAESSKPTFSISGLALQEPSFPQHNTTKDGKGNSQSDALGENPTKAGDASPQMPEPVEIVESESDDLPNEPPSYSQDIGAVQSGGLDDEFISFGDASDVDEAEPEQAAPPTSDKPAERAPVWRDDELPWYQSNLHIESQTLRLHNEIVEINNLLRPVPSEDAQRIEARDLIDKLIKAIFPTARLETFGSFATGLHLPTSDVDCVILCDEISPSGVVQALRAIGQSLQRSEWATEVEVVSGAKVPIVKLVVMPYGLKFDISVGKGNGIAAVEYIRSQLAAWPPLRPLVTILKLFLLQRQMNEVYTGGLSSFSLILSVIAFLKMHYSRKSRQPGKVHNLDCNLGLLLIDYFRFYGRQLDYSMVGVSCNDGGYCYVKNRVFPQQPRFRKSGSRGDRFSIMDPLDSSNDVAGGSFGSSMVRSAFDHAYQMLSYQAPGMQFLPTAEQRRLRGKPLLGSILRLNDVLAIRPAPPVASRDGGGGGPGGGGGGGRRGNRSGDGGQGDGGMDSSRGSKRHGGGGATRDSGVGPRKGGGGDRSGRGDSGGDRSSGGKRRRCSGAASDSSAGLSLDGGGGNGAGCVAGHGLQEINRSRGSGVAADSSVEPRNGGRSSQGARQPRTCSSGGVFEGATGSCACPLAGGLSASAPLSRAERKRINHKNRIDGKGGKRLTKVCPKSVKAKELVARAKKGGKVAKAA